MKVNIRSKTLIGVRISDISDDEATVYIAKTEKDCHDEVDLEVFNLVKERHDVIRIGFVFGEPVFD